MLKKISIAVCSLFLINSAIAQHLCSESKIKFYKQQNFKANANSSQMAEMERYDVKHIELDLKVERTSTYIAGNVKTVAQITSSVLDTFLFQLHNALTIDSVLDENNVKLNFYRVNDVAYVLLGSTKTQNSLVYIKVFYKGTPPNSGGAAIGNGFSNASSPTYGNQITWSLSQPYSAYEWFPCKQSLQDKIDSVFINVTTDTSNKVGSNGNLMLVEPNTNGKHTYRWKTFYPISYYLISVSVGKYNVYTQYAKPAQVSDSVLILNYIYNQTAYNNNKANIEATKPMLELFGNLFSVYPFYKEKYGHSMAPFSGGMEHQTMTTQGVFPYTIVAHELGHQWFGDNVTCATWADIWLNEGFATYTEYLAMQYLKTPTEAFSDLTDMQNRAKASNNLSVYVEDTVSVDRIFSSAITYNKGGSVIHVLRYLIGSDSVFFGMLKAYHAQFKNSNANTQQFNQFVNNYTGKNFDYYFNQWVYGAGYPNYQAKWNYSNSKVVLAINQTNANGSNNLFSLPIPFVLATATGDTTIYVNNSSASETVTFNVGRNVLNVSIDPESWILKTATISKDITLIPAGVDKSNIENQVFSIYPNPAKTAVTILHKGLKNAVVNIFNTQGKLVLSQPLKDDNKIDIAGLAKGVYEVELITGNNKLAQQLVVE